MPEVKPSDIQTFASIKVVGVGGAGGSAVNRMKEAGEIEGLQVFVVSCPKDLTMFEDALKTSGFEGKFVVRELIELIDECIEYEVWEELQTIA